MLGVLRRIPVRRLAFLSFFIDEKSADNVKTPGYEELNKKYKGMEGLSRMFQTDEYGEWSPEFTLVVHMAAAGIIVGVFYGAMLEGREAFAKFVENNQATQFNSHLDAKKQLQDRVTWAMGKGALKWGSRIGGFVSIFMFANTCIRVYRGEPGFIEYLGAGIITGGALRLKLGPKGIVAGSIVGGVLGAIAGALQMSVLYLAGYTIEDIEKYQHDFQTTRNENIRHAIKNHLREEYEIIEYEKSRKHLKETKSTPLEIVPDVEAE